MTHAFWSERLSPWLDGELDGEAARSVAAHVDGCPECRRVADDLEEIRRRARALGASGPETDLWPAIEAGLWEREETRVIDFSGRIGQRRSPTDPDGRTPSGRAGDEWEDAAPRARVRVPAWSLGLAAGVALAAGWGLGAALTGSNPGGTVASVPSAGIEDPELIRVRSQVVPPERARTLAGLEARFRARSDVLSPGTVARLERNLATIDRAIAESLRALAEDPDNQYLRSHAGLGVERRERLLRSVLSMLEVAE